MYPMQKVVRTNHVKRFFNLKLFRTAQNVYDKFKNENKNNSTLENNTHKKDH